MRFHQKLAKLCEGKGWDQQELARRSGISKSTISAWLNDEGKPSWQMGPKLSRALDVPLEHLADDAQDDPPAPAPVLSDGEKALLRLGHRLGIDSSLELIAITLTERGLAKPKGMTPAEFKRDVQVEPLPPRPKRK